MELKEAADLNQTPNMVKIEGKYLHQKNENLDEYFRLLGVPYVPRKMMCSSSPTLEITKNEDEWAIAVSSLFRTVTSKFKLGEPYEESMPGGILKNTTTMEGDDKLVTKTVGPKDSKTTRLYEFSDEGCIVTYTYEENGTVAKRYFKRTE